VNIVLASEVVAQAQDALHAGCDQNAVLLAEHVISRFPRHAQARLIRSLGAEVAGKADQALDDLRFVTSAEPLNFQAALAYARIFSNRNDEARAKANALRAVELVPRPQHYGALEIALDILGLDAEALVVTPAVFARIHLRSGWPGTAVRYARRALDNDPDRVDIRLTLAESLWRLNRLSLCEEQCTIIFDRANDCVRAAVMLAHVLAERGRTAEGQDLLDRAGEIDPEYREARQMLAQLELHRLVLPKPPHIDPPPNTQPDNQQPPATGSQQTTMKASAGTPPNFEQSDVKPTSLELAGPPDPNAHGKGHTEASSLPGPSAPMSPAIQAPDQSELTVRPPEALDEVAASLTITQMDWARELLQRGDWIEAERVIREISSDTELPLNEVDTLLEEAATHEAIAAACWQLLGDFRMRAQRPQAAAEAYLHATNLQRDSSG
jgi:tetratricopeptide (TPR) repeat protein